MTDIKAWVDEHRKLMVYAPIAVEADNYGVARFVSDGWPIPAHGSHATAIVDAHNTLPTALSMVEAVLELHKPDSNGNCEVCLRKRYEDRYARTIPYPCPTVRALEGVIDGE